MKANKDAVTAIAAIAVLALGCGDLQGAAESATVAVCSPKTRVETAYGAVCGRSEDGVTTYYGIPFAEPPVGELRWRAPRPAQRWSGVLEAIKPGSTCAAPGRSGISGKDGETSGNENCLFLNVQAPVAARAGSKLPVIVWIHGGGFLITAFGRLPDSSNLAEQVVVVAISYRTGVMGFLAAEALGPHSGNYGIQDQQAALRWVQQNIAAFGGDPGRVTIYGTSAGGASVCAHIVSPDSRGLFHRGISRSGFYNAAVGPDKIWQLADCKSAWLSEGEAQAAGAALVEKVGCKNAGDVGACLRALPVGTLITNAAQTQTPKAGGTVAPIVDGKIMPMSPARAFAMGRVNPVSMIMGVSRDEINGGVSTPQVVANTAVEYRSHIQEKYGSLAPRVMNLYPLERFPKTAQAFLAYRTVVADADSVCPALTAFRNLSEHIRVYAYQVDDGAAPADHQSATEPWGANHGTGDAGNGKGESANLAALSAQVSAAWIGFAKDGDPTAPGAPYWPAYTSKHPLVMSLVQGGASAVMPASVIASQHHCDFWDMHTPLPGH